MSIPMLLDADAEVVIAGGGPVGLASAIQIKKFTGRDVVVIEKYRTYQRTDINLRIEAASMVGFASIDEPLSSLL